MNKTLVFDSEKIYLKKCKNKNSKNWNITMVSKSQRIFFKQLTAKSQKCSLTSCSNRFFVSIILRFYWQNYSVKERKQDFLIHLVGLFSCFWNPKFNANLIALFTVRFYFVNKFKNSKTTNLSFLFKKKVACYFSSLDF